MDLVFVLEVWESVQCLGQLHLDHVLYCSRLNIPRLPALVTNVLAFTQWNSNACVYDANFILHKLPEFVYKVEIYDRSHAPKNDYKNMLYQEFIIRYRGEYPTLIYPCRRVYRKVMMQQLTRFCGFWHTGSQKSLEIAIVSDAQNSHIHECYASNTFASCLGMLLAWK